MEFIDGSLSPSPFSWRCGMDTGEGGMLSVLGAELGQGGPGLLAPWKSCGP